MGEFILGSNGATFLKGDMCNSDSIVLKTGEPIYCEFDRAEKFRLKNLFLALIIILVFTIIGLILAYIFYFHPKIATLKSTHEELVTMKLQQLVTSLEREYNNAIRHNVSNASFFELEDLLELHNATKKKALQTFSEDPEIFEILESQLSKKLDDLFEAITSEHSTKMNIKISAAIRVMELMTQIYFLNLQGEVFEKDEEMLQVYHQSECQRILNEFEAASTLPTNSSMHQKLSVELESSLNQVYDQVTHDWNLKMENASEQVKRNYYEIMQEKNWQHNISGEQMIPPEISFKVHDKATEMAILKSVRDNLGLPVTGRVFNELKLCLDKLYQKEVTENAVIGIDFGWKYARSAVYLQGKIQTIPHFDLSGVQYNSTATYVGIEAYDGWVGQCAEEVLESSILAAPIIYDMRLIMRYWNKTKFDARPEASFWSFNTYPGNVNGSVIPEVSAIGDEARYSLTLTVSKLLHQIRKNAEEFVGVPINKCVIAFPWYFYEQQILLLIEAGKIAGFTEVTLLEDFTAAAVALQQVNSPWKVAKNVLFIDFGERLWYFYILEGMKTDFKVVKYDWYIEGFNLPNNMARHCMQQFCDVEGIDLKEVENNATIRKRRLFEVCERVVNVLTTEEVATITVLNFFEGKTLSVNITRVQFEELNAAQFDKISRVINRRLSAASLTKEQIHEVVLAGTQANILKVQEIIRNYFPGRRIHVSGLQSEEVIAYGAAVKGAILAAQKMELSRVNRDE